MKIFLEFDDENFIELERVLKISLEGIKNLNTHFLVEPDNKALNAISLVQLKCYEKHKDTYKFFFADKSVVDYDYRVAKRLLKNRVPRGFIQINKSDVVNFAYIDRVFDNSVYIYGEDFSRKIGSVYRNDFEETLKKRCN